MSSTLPVSPTASGVALRVRVQPRTARDEIAGIVGDMIRVRLAAPPVDGAANQALVRFLASRLQVAVSAVTLVRGHNGRNKVVTVTGVSERQATERLLADSDS